MDQDAGTVFDDNRALMVSSITLPHGATTEHCGKCWYGVMV